VGLCILCIHVYRIQSGRNVSLTTTPLSQLAYEIAARSIPPLEVFTVSVVINLLDDGS
jgi:hypothetical protein